MVITLLIGYFLWEQVGMIMIITPLVLIIHRKMQEKILWFPNIEKLYKWFFPSSLKELNMCFDSVSPEIFLNRVDDFTHR